MPERLKGADCKSAGSGLRWFESSSTHLEQICYPIRPMASNGIYIRFDSLAYLIFYVDFWKDGRVVQCISFEN